MKDQGRRGESADSEPDRHQPSPAPTVGRPADQRTQKEAGHAVTEQREADPDVSEAIPLGKVQTKPRENPRMENTVEQRRERLLRLLSAATFLIFFQAYMVAPLIPRLAAEFGVSGEKIGLAIPAYMVPYGVSTLFYSLLSDRLGRRRIMLASLAAFIVLTALTATARSASELIFWRLITGLGASGVVPLALALIGNLFPYDRRGRPLGWLFGTMAGGMAFGSTLGVVLVPFVGWRLLFVGVAGITTVISGLLLRQAALLGSQTAHVLTLSGVVAGYRSLLQNKRGARTYAYVCLEIIVGDQPVEPLNLFALTQYEYRGDGLNSEAVRYRHVAFDVHAINRSPSYVSLGHAFQARLQSPAGRTARLIEIQRYRPSCVKSPRFELVAR